MLKKSLVLLLTLCMVISLVPMQAWADTGVNIVYTNNAETNEGGASPADVAAANDEASTKVAKVGDTEYATIGEAVAAAGSGDTIVLMNGEYELPTFSGKELTFKGETKDGVIINDAPDARAQGWLGSTFHFENLTAKGATANYHGLANGVVKVTYKNCNVNGLRFLYAHDVSFEACAFDAEGGEHSFWTYGASNITVTNCTFTYTDRAVNCYSENGANHETDIAFTGCTFIYAGTADAPEGAVEINSGSVKSIDLTMDDCTAPANGAMWFNSQWDSKDGANTTVTKDGEVVWHVAKGNSFNGYTGSDAIWGETWGNAKESFVIKVLDANGNVMGTTTLNNIGGIIDGDVGVTWNLKLDAESNTDEYWTMEWTTAPSIDNMPASVELWVDGVKVSGGPVVLNGPDDIAKIYAANVDENGKILSYNTSVADAVKNSGNVVLLRDVTVADTLTVPANATVTLDLNGKTISQTKAQTGNYQMILNDGNLTVMDSVGGGKISYTDTVGGNFISNTITNRGTFVLKSGTVENLSSAAVANAGFPYAIDTSIWGAATEVNTVIEGGTVTCANYSAIRLRADSETEAVNVTVSGGTINGRIEVQNPTSNKATVGKLSITGGTVNQNNSSKAIMIFGGGGTAENMEVAISGGTVNGVIGYSSSFPINGFNENVITGGTFSEDVSAFVADGFVVKQNADGTYGVAEKAMPTVNGVDVVISDKGDGVYDITLNAGASFPEGGVTMTFPTTGNANGMAYVVHEHDGVNCIYVGKVSDGKFSFKNTVGFSTFTVVDGGLQQALNAAAAGTGNITVEILADIDLTDVDWAPVTVSAPGYPMVTVNGNGKTITGLNDMLFAGTWAGNSGLIINDLTIANSTIVHDENDAAGNIGVGAFIGFPQASSVITLNNCHLVDSTVSGGHWTGGLIGYAAGYAGTDGPVFMNLTIKECSVTGSTITGKGSVGGIIGHATGNAWTNVAIETTTVSGNTVTSTGSSTNKAGAVVGTIGAAGQATTVNGVEKTGGVAVSATVSGNNVTSNGTTITTVYGRQGTNTGKLEISGGTYDKYPIEENVSYAAPIKGYVIEENADGTYGVAVDPAYGKVAKIGDTYYATLAEAIAAAKSDDEIVLLADTAEDVTVPAGVIFNGNGKQVGVITAAGEITFKGHTKATNFSVQYTNTTINIGEGACLEITGTGRMVIGHGCTFNITGTITDAKAANVADLTPSLVVNAGASFTGTNLNFKVTNAYIKFLGNSTSKNSNANGTFNFNVTNSIWEQTGVLAFYVPTSGMDPTFNLTLKDSVLTTTSHLVFSVTKGEIVFDNSNVNVGTSRQIENRSTMTIKNGSVVNGAVATSSNAINPGTITVEDATYAVTGQFSGATEGTGTLVIKKGATVSVGSIVDKANVVIDATEMTAGDEVNFTGDLSKFAGTVEVINNSALEAQIVDGKIVLAEKPVAMIGDVKYATLAEAIAAVKANGGTLTLLANAYESMTFNYPADGAPVEITIDLNGFTITSAESTLWVSDGYVVTVKDSVGTGKIVTTSNNGSDSAEAIAVNRDGKVILEGGTVEAPYYGVFLYSGNTIGKEVFVMNGGKIEVPNGGQALSIGKGKATINGGEVIINKVPGGAGWNTVVYENGVLDITGGKFFGTVGNWGTISISGGTFAYPDDPNDGFNNDHLALGYTTEVDENGIVKVVAIPARDDGFIVVTTYRQLLAALEVDNAKVIMANDITATAGTATGYGKAGVVLNVGDILDGDGHKLTINGANTTWDCAVAMLGGEVRNLTISGAFRGVFMPGANGDVVIDNCEFENVVYTFNSDAGSKDYSVTIKNSTLNGWTSFSNVHDSVTFDTCTFGEGSGNAHCVPYQATNFVNCDFAEGYTVDTESVADNALAFNGCTYADEAISATNALDLFYNGGKVVVDGASVDYTRHAQIVRGENILEFTTLAEAIAALEDGDTLTISAGEISEGTIKFPASLKNVTIKGADGNASILKDMTLMACDGSNIAYEGITFDGIVFDNSNILFPGQRASASFKDWTITNCTFKNVARGNAAISFNLNASEAMENFTFTNNVIDGVTGGSYSGLVLRASKGDIVVTGNDIKNVAWNAIQLINSTADTLKVEGNSFASGADEGILNLYGVTATALTIKNNKFLVAEGQPGVCYITAADVSENYWGGNAPANLPAGVVCASYYKDEALTQLVELTFVAEVNGTKYESITEALAVLQANGGTLELLADASINASVVVFKDTVINGNGKKLTVTGAYGIDVKAAGVNLAINNLTVESNLYALNLRGASDNAVVTITDSTLTGCIALNVWGKNVSINATNSAFTSVDASTQENYSAIALNNNGTKSAENTVINITGGSITALDENDAPSIAIRNATATGVANVSDTTVVTGEIREVVSIVTYNGNDAFYSHFTLQESINRAANDPTATVKLLRDITESVTITGTVVLDLNGKTISGDTSPIVIDNGGDLTIKDSASNGAVVATGNFAVLLSGSGKLTLESGTLKADSYAVYLVNADSQFVMNGGTVEGKMAIGVNGGNAVIKSGTIIAHDMAAPMYVWSGSMSISGGTFNFSPSADYIAYGYGITDNADGTYTVSKVDPMIFIGSNSYYTLDEAFKAASENDVITITKAGKYTWTNTAVPAGVTVKGTVEGVVVDGNRTMINATKLTVENIDFTAINEAVYITNGKASEITFTDCSFTGNYSLLVDSAAEDSVFTFNNCIFNGFTTFASSVGEVKVNGGEINNRFVVRQDAEIKDAAISEVDAAGIQIGTSDVVTGVNVTLTDCTVKDANNDGAVPSIDEFIVVNNVSDDSDNMVVVDGTILYGGVAKIGETRYATLQEAIDAAQPGDTVTILAGEYTADITLNKAITLVGETDAEGNNLVNITGRIAAYNGVTVKNLNVTNAKTGDYDCALAVNGADIVIDGVKLTGYNAMRYCYASGDITIKNSTINGTNFAVHFDGSEGGNVVFENCDITGWCSFASTVNSVSYTNCAIDQGDYSGHRYYNKNVSFTECDFAEGMKIDLKASGTDVAITDSSMTVEEAKALFKDPYYVANGNVTVNGQKITYVASAYTSGGTKYFDSLQAAIDEVNNGGYITVRSDVVLTAPITVPAGKSVEIGLGDFNITYTADVMGEAMITNNGDLTISGNGKIVYTYTGAADSNYGKGNYTIANNGKLTIDGVTVENATAKMSHASYAITNGNGGEIIVKDGLVLNTNNYAVRLFGKGSLTVEGGEIKGTRAVWMQAPGSNTADAPEIALTVNGGKLTATGESADYKLAVYSYSYGNSMANVSITVNGGVLDGDIALTGGANKTVAETVTITGGTITDLYSYASDEVASETINVSGGTFNAPIAEAYCADGFIPTANADGTYGVKAGAYVAEVDGVKYESLAEALAAANGKTVALTMDVTENMVLVPDKNVTLDLNGYTLTANHLVAFNGSNVIDSSDGSVGLLKVAKGNVILAKNNAQMPVWNGEGYRFFTFTMQQMPVEGSLADNRVSLVFLPDMDDTTLLAGDDHDLLIGVRITFQYAGNTQGTATEDFIFSADWVKRIYSNNSAFSLALSGVKSVSSMTITSIVISQSTGLEITGAVSTLNG